MSMLDIVSLAHTNESVLQESYQKCIKEVFFDDSHIVNDFESYLEESIAASINLNHFNLKNVINGGSYKSAFELHGDYDIAKKHYGSRSAYRQKIDLAFNYGKYFKYFALNGGNMGMPVWGHYCLVFDLNIFEVDKTVVLMRNSLEKNEHGKYYYFDENDDIDIGKIMSELSKKELYKIVVVLKSKEVITETQRNEWCELVCKSADVHKDSDYIELITFQECKIDNKNVIIRIKKFDFDKLFEYWDRKIKNLTLGPKWGIVANEFDELIKLISIYNFKIQAI